MFEILLKQNELEALYIIKTIVNKGPTPLGIIEKNIKKDKSTIRKKIDILNDTIHHLGYKHLQLIIQNGKIVLDNFDFAKHSALPSHLCEYFISHSATYKVIHTLLNHPQVSQDELLTNVHISESYLNKILKRINSILAPANISIVSRNKIYIFEGPKNNWVHIDFYTRLFLASLSSMLIKQPPNQQKLPAEHIAAIHAQLLQAIKHFIDPFDLQTDDPENHMSEIIQLLREPLEQPTQDHSQQLLYHFFVCLTHNYFESPTHRKLISQKILLANELILGEPLIKDTLTIANHLFLPDKRTTDSYFEMIYLVFMLQLQHRLLDSMVQRIFTVPTAHSLAKTAASQMNQEQFKEDILSLNLSATTKSLLTTVSTEVLDQLFILYCSNHLQKPKLKLFISLDTGLSHILYIKHKILAVFSTDAIQFTDQFIQADIVISDYYWNSAQYQGMLYQIDSHSIKDIDGLLTFILKQLTRNEN